MTASHDSFLLKSRVRFVFVCKVYGSWLFPWMYFLIPGVLYVLDGFFSCYEKKLCTMYTDVQYYRGPSYVLSRYVLQCTKYRRRPKISKIQFDQFAWRCGKRWKIHSKFFRLEETTASGIQKRINLSVCHSLSVFRSVGLVDELVR